MIFGRIPIAMLGATVCAYWFCVGVMVVRVGRRTREVKRVLVPAQRTERFMWAVWVPLILTWMILPWLALRQHHERHPWLAPPDPLIAHPGISVLRLMAAGMAVLCLLGSIRCWRHMGAQWRMAVDATQKSLILDGPFARVRHPIYALSIGLMVCSILVLPTVLMLVLATVHIALMHLKAHNEERFLRQMQPDAYARYCRRTGRFLPRIGGQEPPEQTDGREEEVPRVPAAQLLKPEPSSPVGQLDYFQQAMILWDELHPYNAVHVVRVRGAADVSKLREAIWAVCRDAEIGELVIDAQENRYWYLPLNEIPIRELPAGESESETLLQVVTQEMNTPFPPRAHHPLRWTVFNASRGNTHYVVVTYHHIAADAEAIQALVAAILIRTFKLQKEPSMLRLTVRHPEGDGKQSSLGHRIIRGLGFWKTVVLYFRFRYVHKLQDERIGGDYTLVATKTVPANLFEQLSEVCRRKNAGVNDAFLGAMAVAIAERTPSRHKRGHRRKLALLTALNKRGQQPDASLTWFGSNVGDMLVVIGRPDAGIDDVIAQIAVQTRRQKTKRDAGQSISAARLFVIRHLWPFLGIPHIRRSYRKLFPVCAGVTTVFVNASRFSEVSQGIVSYLRICPPGPVTPMVLAPTVWNGRLELSLVYRATCLTPEKADDLLNAVLAGLAEFCGNPHPALASGTVETV